LFTAFKAPLASAFVAVFGAFPLVQPSEPSQKTGDQTILAGCAKLHVRLDAGRTFGVQFLTDIQGELMAIDMGPGAEHQESPMPADIGTSGLGLYIVATAD